MALSVGSVTVNSDGTHTGSGLALALFEAQLGSPWIMSLFDTITSIYTDPVPQIVRQKQGIAAFVASLSAGIVGYITANAEVTITVSTSDAGLQRTPDPNNPNTATQGPSAPVTLATKGTIT